MISLKQVSFCIVILCSFTIVCAEVNKAEQIAPDVYFHEGDLKGHGHCNNGWIVFDDYVLVIDGNFPSGAQEIIPKIKAVTDKPIRFAFDTHHHGDHAYGNQIWTENGATPVAHVGVIEEMKKYETGYYGDMPGRWEDSAKTRKDVAASKLHPPTLLYRNEMIFDDGKHRVELLHFGVAHTHGDGFAWLPKEKILFTGDACVNGPYNFAGDGDTGEWVKTLEAAKKLGAKIVCPGHGPRGTGQVLADQQAFFVELRNQVKKVRRKSPAVASNSVEQIRLALLSDPQVARYVGDFLQAQVEKAYTEMGGKPFLAKAATKSEPAWRPLPLIKNGKIDPSWVHLSWGGFVVDDGTLRTAPDSKGLGLLTYSRERFGNCQIRVVFKPKEAKSNSGVYVRIDDGVLEQANHPGAAFERDASGKPSDESMERMKETSEKEEGAWFAVHRGFEIQIADGGDAYHRTAAVYSLAPSSGVSTKPLGEWRTMIITLAGTKIFVDLDGQRVTSFDSTTKDASPRKQWHEPKREPKRPEVGYIGLQNHDPGDIVWFKEISVRPLPAGFGK